MVTIQLIQIEHWQAVKEIYEEGIRTGNATFEKQAPDFKVWDKGHLKHSRMVASLNSEIAGWAALSPFSGRSIYAGVAEVSVYVKQKYRGQKVGNLLLHSLVTDSEAKNIWTLQSGIFPENKASIKIHEANGFRIVGYREKIGQMNGIWRDTILMERRSKNAGTS